MNPTQKAALMAGLAAGALAVVLKAPLWGTILAGAGAAFVTTKALATAPASA